MLYQPQKDESVHDFVHIRLKSAYAGAKSIIEDEVLLFNEGFCNKSIKHSPCYYHCINEVIVNAYDNLVKNYEATKAYGGRCEVISVTISQDLINVKNDGKGIDVEERKHTDGKKYWNPYLICSQLRTGSNLQNKDKVVGGDNGFGLKLPFYHSEYFKVKTYDKFNKRYYEQIFTCDLKDANSQVKIGDPIISNRSSFEGTEFEFRLCKKFLGYNSFTEDDHNNLYAYIKGLLICLNFHVHSLGYQVLTILNGKRIKENITYDFSESQNKFNVYVGTPMNFSFVNNLTGLLNPSSTHAIIVRKQINEALKTRLTKFCSDNGLTAYNINKIFKNITLTISAQIKDISPNSQRKEKIQFDESKVNITFSQVFLEKIYEAVIAKLKLQIKAKPLKTPKVGKIDFIKPNDKVKQPILIITEGKHASQAIDVLLSYIDRQAYGIFDIRGVPVNTYKAVTFEDGVYKMSKKFLHLAKDGLLSNRLIHLMTILGLKQGQTDFSKLKYKMVLIATDNDEDGKGNIFMMLLLFFYVFWPKLFDLGFIGRWQTPLIRLEAKTKKPYPISQTEFYSEEEFNQYLATQGDVEDMKTLLSNTYDIKYFKGLGSHTKSHIKKMSREFESNILYYKLTKTTSDIIEIMWGKNTQLRKDLLSDVPKREVPNIIKRENKLWVTVNNHIRNEVLYYHLLKISRALPSYIDGQTISRRKIIYCSFSKLKKKMTVAAFAGLVKTYTDYHHGETSLEGTIISLCQSFKGANPIPLLRGIGTFGTLLEGVNSDIQARYVEVTRDDIAELVFPKDDFPLYDYNYGDQKLEPVIMVPIIPLAVLINRDVPGTGWKNTTWARSIKAVFKYVRCLINKKKTFSLWGKMESPHGKLSSIGKSQEEETAIFTVQNGKILITELPLGMYIEPFIKSLPEECKAQNLTTKKSLKIEVEGLSPSSHLLTNKYSSHLNFLGENGVVVFSSYEELVNAWFVKRRDLYIAQRQRNLDVIKVLIIREKNIISFIERYDEFKVNKDFSKEDWTKVLSHFEKVDISWLNEARDPYMALKHGNYRYIKDLTITSVGLKALSKHKDKLAELEKKLAELEKKTIESIWLDDLSKLEELL